MLPLDHHLPVQHLGMVKALVDAVDRLTVGPFYVADAPVIEYGAEQRRMNVLPYVVVDRPAGGTQAERTLLDLLEYPTLADLAAAYDSLYDVLAGP